MYLSLYCKGSKRVTQGFTVRGSWRPNRTAIYWPPLLWPSALCLSHSPGLLNRRPWGSALCWMMAFFTASYHQLVSKTPSGVLRFPLAGCGFPYHNLSPMSLIPNSSGPQGLLRPGVAFPTTSCLLLQLSNFLSWPSYIIVQCPLNRPLNLWNGMFDRHQAEITVMQFRGLSLPVYQSMSVPWDFLPCPISSAKHAYAISSHNCHWNVSLPSGMASLAGLKVKIQHKLTSRFLAQNSGLDLYLLYRLTSTYTVGYCNGLCISYW